VDNNDGACIAMVRSSSAGRCSIRKKEDWRKGRTAEKVHTYEVRSYLKGTRERSGFGFRFNDVRSPTVEEVKT
jgi:hypothetical protein